MFNNWLLLISAGVFSGAINSVAGGGSFIAYPALLAMGIPPIASNATISMVILPGYLTSAIGYKKHVKDIPKKYYWLMLPCAIGSFIGATILTKTSNSNFTLIVPYFIFFAVILLALQPFLHKKLFSKNGLKLQKHYPKTIAVISILAFLIASVYGGYFGAGFGIILLGFLGLTNLKNINQMNSLKNILAIGVAIVASINFISHGIIAWQVVPLFVLGNTIGGYYGARYISRLPESVIRMIIVAIGLVLAIILFIRL